MKYLDLEKCLTMIDESKIDRYNYANIYVGSSKNDICLVFEYSDKLDNDIELSRTTSKETKLTEEVWKEYLAASALIEKKYGVERIIDDAGSYDSNEIENKSPYELKEITVTYRMNVVQERRLQRITNLLNEMGFEYTISDTLQSMIYGDLPADLDNKLSSYEALLL